MTDATNKPVIFLAFANDRDDTVGYLRNLPDEARRLRDVLQPAEQAGLCEVVVRSNSTAGDIFKVFQDPQYRNRIAIFHYGGHANGYQLLLESSEGESAAADAGGLAAFLSQQQGLVLVFLNGCSTLQQTQGLLAANISAVISTSKAIGDEVATDFSYQFYQGLGGGAGLKRAFDEAGAAVQMTQGSDTRSLYFGDVNKITDSFDADRLPWLLSFRRGAEHVSGWNLPNSVDDPLFGLPTLPEQDLPESPFRHLKWFTRKDAEVFFGRGHQIRELHGRLTAPRTAPIILFYGQSGVGKSSLLDAGLIPRLEKDYEVRYVRRTASGLLETLQSAFSAEASGVPIETAWRVTEEQIGKPLIVFLDQVEEVYTRPDVDETDELSQFLEVVQATFVESDQRPGGKLVLGFRKEWLAELEAQLAACELPRTKVFLEPLDRRGIVEAVEGPALSGRLREHYGLTVEDGLGNTIADDLLADRDSAIAPTLQILLTKMWTKATSANYEQPSFTQELYQDLKRDGILLRDFLDQQIAAFRERYPEAVDSGLLLDIVALHTTPLGSADQRTLAQLQEQYAHLGATLPKLLQQCQDLHLLTVAASTQKENTRSTRLAHDTLAPLVREHYDVSDKPGQRARRILDNRSVDWEDDREGAPLDEADLTIVERGAGGTHALTPTEERLLNASRELRARLQRTRRILRIAGAVAVMVIAVIAVVAALGWNEANKQTRLAKDQETIAKEKTKEAKEQKRKAETALVAADTNRGLARELMSGLVPEVADAVDFSQSQKEDLAESSREYFDRFVTQQLTEEGEPDPDTLAVVADAKYVIGRLYREQASKEALQFFDLAEQSLERARDWQFRKLNCTPHTLSGLGVEVTNVGMVEDLSYTLTELGHTYRLHGQTIKSIKRTSQEYEEGKGPDQEKLMVAKTQYTHAELVRKKLAEFEREFDPDHIEYRLLHASAVMNIGIAHKNLKNNKGALEKFDRADEICEKLPKPSTDQTKTHFIWHHVAALANHNRALVIQIQKGANLEQAEKLETKAIDYYAELPKDDFAIQAELATAYRNRGTLSFNLKKHDVASEDFAAAAEIWKDLRTRRSWVPKYQNQQKRLFFVWNQIIDYLKKRVMKSPEDAVTLSHFGAWSLQYKTSHKGMDDLAAEVSQLEENVKWWREKCEQQPEDPEYQRVADENLAKSLLLHAEALISSKMHDQASVARQEALGLWGGLLEQANSSDRARYQRGRDEAQSLITHPPAGHKG